MTAAEIANAIFSIVGLGGITLQLQVPFSPKNTSHSVRAPYASCANWAREKARTADLKRIVQPYLPPKWVAQL
jgi:hypothetical protein